MEKGRGRKEMKGREGRKGNGKRGVGEGEEGKRERKGKEEKLKGGKGEGLPLLSRQIEPCAPLSLVVSYP